MAKKNKAAPAAWGHWRTPPPLPLPTRRSDDQQDAGPYVVGQIVPVVDHHLEVGVCARKIAPDCTPICATLFRKVCVSRLFSASFESYRGSSRILSETIELTC